MKYAASYDNTVKAVTLLVFAVMVFVSVNLIRHAPAADLTTRYIVMALLWVFMVVVYGFSITRYEVTNDALRIVRPFATKTIELNNITHIQALPTEALGTLIRTFANGGLFGYYGQYKSSTIGYFTFYGTQRKNHILIETTTPQRLVITPDDMALLDALKAGLKE
jgi:hypothetical protein